MSPGPTLATRNDASSLCNEAATTLTRVRQHRLTVDPTQVHQMLGITTVSYPVTLPSILLKRPSTEMLAPLSRADSAPYIGLEHSESRWQEDSDDAAGELEYGDHDGDDSQIPLLSLDPSSSVHRKQITTRRDDYLVSTSEDDGRPNVQPKETPIPWRQLALVILVQFCERLTTQVLNPFIPQVLHTFI